MKSLILSLSFLLLSSCLVGKSPFNENGDYNTTKLIPNTKEIENLERIESEFKRDYGFNFREIISNDPNSKPLFELLADPLRENASVGERINALYLLRDEYQRYLANNPNGVDRDQVVGKLGALQTYLDSLNS